MKLDYIIEDYIIITLHNNIIISSVHDTLGEGKGNNLVVGYLFFLVLQLQPFLYLVS